MDATDETGHAYCRQMEKMLRVTRSYFGLHAVVTVRPRSAGAAPAAGGRAGEAPGTAYANKNQEGLHERKL